LLTHLAGIIDGLSQRRRSTFSDAWYGALTAACRSGISLEQVEDLERLLRDPLLPGGHQGDPAWPDHLRAAKAELGADLQGAVDSYSRAVTPDGWRRSVPARADALLGLARVQLVAADRAGAKKSASRASGLLDRWPGWRRDEARALIRRLEAAGSPSHLTPREREVAVLVAEGLSNGEIGRRLFISTKTASVHVSAILRKLAMSNRSEIAAWAVRSGMVPQ
jgi:DNA-binding CsgD family transcriptional regulator